MIRLLRDGEGSLWRDIRLSALEQAPSVFSARYEDWAARPLSHYEAQVADRGIFVAEHERRVVGVACLVKDDDPNYSHRGWVMSVYVRPEIRGQGVANKLLIAAIEAARVQAMTELFLDVGKTNHAAQQAYLHAGFRTLPNDQRPVGSDDCCEVTMWRQV